MIEYERKLIIILIEDDFTHIHTLNKGTILIKDVQIGDLVYTQNLDWQPIINITKHKYKNKIYSLYLQHKLPINITEDQEILIIPASVKNTYYNYPISDFYKKYIQVDYINLSKFARDFELQWIPANKVQNKDCIVTPINYNNQDINNLDYLDINHYKIKINIDFLLFLGYIYIFAEIDNNVCHFYIHKAFSRIKNWLSKYVNSTFNTHLTISKKMMFYNLYTNNNQFVQMIQFLLNTGIPPIIKTLLPKQQLYIFKSIFSLQRNDNSLTFNTINLTLLYDLLEILHRNYINPEIDIKDDQYQILIKRKYYNDFSKFIFQNDNNDKLYTTNITNFTSLQFPTLYNNINYMNYPLNICNIYTPKKSVNAVSVQLKDNIPLKINTLLIK